MAVDERVPHSLKRLKYVVRYGDGHVDCKICGKPVEKGSTAIKIKIPMQVMIDAGLVTHATCKKSIDRMFFQDGPIRGAYHGKFHWHCYRDWDFRLDKICARITPELTTAERKERNERLGRKYEKGTWGNKQFERDE